ncbi:MAG: hypothetical protein D6778_07035 [Nitrospirae bacterium]|nr:MAG: hypothetical protein D6778_07035 [Nitrospirota bacterium]
MKGSERRNRGAGYIDTKAGVNLRKNHFHQQNNVFMRLRLDSVKTVMEVADLLPKGQRLLEDPGLPKNQSKTMCEIHRPFGPLND